MHFLMRDPKKLSTLCHIRFNGPNARRSLFSGGLILSYETENQQEDPESKLSGPSAPAQYLVYR